MDKESLLKILANVAAGKTSVEEAAKTLKHLSFEDIDYAHIDHHRSLRKGFPEVIFGQGKTSDQIIGIMDKMLHQENIVLVTRIDQNQAEKVVTRFPEAVYHQDARMLILEKKKDADPGERDHSGALGRNIRHPDCQRSLFNRRGYGQPCGIGF